MEARDDIALLGAIAQQRDHAAFTELYERYQKRVFNLTLRILHNRILAEDAMQEAMLSIWHSAKSFQPNEDAANWILRIVANKSIDLKRSKERSAKREGVVAMEPRNQETTVSLQVEKEELMAMLRSHLDQLPKLESELLACCYGARMSHQEIADKFDISRTRVTRKIQDALDGLQSSLSKAGVAAVVPLIGAEKLFEAMTTGVDCPPGMTERLLSRMANSQSVKSVPRRAAPRKSAGPLTFIAVATAAGALALLFLKQPEPKLVKPIGASSSSDSSPEEKPVHARWTFEKGPENDLKVLEGSWTWKNTGQMVAPPAPGVLVELPVKVPAESSEFPVLAVNLKASMNIARPSVGNHVDSIFNIKWGNADCIRQWTDDHEDEIFSEALNLQFYVIDRYVVILTTTGQIHTIGEYSTRDTSSRISIQFIEFRVREISTRTLSKKELPESLRDLSPWIQKLSKSTEKSSTTTPK